MTAIRRSCTPSPGFTLVELSVVLVIIGLIVGAILVGRDMIKAAELRSNISQFEKVKAAVYVFRDKYNAFPGDIVNASNFWPLADPTPAVCQVTASTGAETCNGNGNGRVELTYERFRFWQQLGNGAGLIGGSYTGVAGPGGGLDAVPGLNVPKLKQEGGGNSVYYLGSTPGTVSVYPGSYKHLMTFGAIHTGAAPDNPLFTPGEAWNIDTKLDDGQPGTGVVTTYKASYRPNCADTDTAATAQYVLTYTGVTCMLSIKLGE